MNYLPLKYSGNNWAIKGKGDFFVWAWWTWKDYDWSEHTVRTGVRFFGLQFYLWKRSL